METKRVGITPTFHDVTITYFDSSSVSPPSNFVAQSGHSLVRLVWHVNNDADIKGYRLYRGTKSKNYDADWTKLISPFKTEYTDTSAITGMTYYYSISAINSDGNESELSEEVKATPLGVKIFVDDDASSTGNGSYQAPYETI
ncbi:MAG: hypothetical protein GWN62_29120, partial [Aliifodinibius sp.]|nr:hypothetical protein [Fodinibius sp.]